METRRGKITSFTACCVLAMAFSACSGQTTTTTTVSGSPSPVAPGGSAPATSPAPTSPTPTPAATSTVGRASVDPALVTRLGAAPWARAIVTVTLNATAAPTLGAALPEGILPGPYAFAKAAALTRGGTGVRLVRDHSALASMVVEFENVAAAKTLAADPSVLLVSADQTRTVLPQPTAS